MALKKVRIYVLKNKNKILIGGIIDLFMFLPLILLACLFRTTRKQNTKIDKVKSLIQKFARDSVKLKMMHKSTTIKSQSPSNLSRVLRVSTVIVSVTRWLYYVCRYLAIFNNEVSL